MNEQILKQVALFASLPPDEVKYLAEILHHREFSAGSIFIQEGEIADHFFILLEGEIEIIKALGTANERVLDVDEAGSFIGEMGLINPGSRRTASVRARTPVRLLEMTRADFDALLHRQPGLAVKMVRVFSLRLEQQQNRTIRDLQEKNLQLTQAYEQLKAAQAHLIEKEKMEHVHQQLLEINDAGMFVSLGVVDGLADVISPGGVKPAPQPQFESFMAFCLYDFHDYFRKPSASPEDASRSTVLGAVRSARMSFAPFPLTLTLSLAEGAVAFSFAASATISGEKVRPSFFASASFKITRFRETFSIGMPAGDSPNNTRTMGRAAASPLS